VSVRLYAVSRAGAVAPGCGGVEHEPLRIVQSEGLAALVGTETGAGVDAITDRGLWRHEQAVEELMSAQDVLPARYGATLDDDGEVCALLERRRGEFDAALAHVSGAVEVGVRAALLDGGGGSQPAEKLESGTAYLHELKRREDLARKLAGSIARALGPIARDSRIDSAWGPSGTLASAHLVDRELLGAFRDRADRLARETTFAHVVCTGPWPPYSFVDAEVKT
jgi:hypothetical protein